MVPLTNAADFARLHDEPSRHIRVFPAKDSSKATFALYEDDGITLRYRDGDFAKVVFEMQTSAGDITLSARVEGSYALPYRQVTIEFPAGEKRCISLSGTTLDIKLG